MITCACGARFEVDETLAGQEVLCPDCQQPLKAPAAERPPQLTSGWALASVVLALVGAFTVFGSLVAVFLGVIALVSIARHRQQVSGTGFAVFGICLGALFTGLTLFALNTADVFGLETWLRERNMARQVDTTGPLEVVDGLKGFAITRPTEKWGQVRGNQSEDPAVAFLQKDRDLLLMQVTQHAFLDVRKMPPAPGRTFEQCQTEVLAEFENNVRQIHLDEDDEDFHHLNRARLQASRQLGIRDGAEVRELEVDARLVRQSWHFLIRMYRRGNGPIYVIRAYTPKRNLGRIESELQTGLDSFRILGR